MGIAPSLKPEPRTEDIGSVVKTPQHPSELRSHLTE